jgi:hypothetical protein
MKKFLFFGAMVALLLGTAACSSDIEPVAGDEALVTFTVNLGDGIDSRSISDGTGANILKFAVYTEDGQHISALDQTVVVENKMATIQTRLTRYHNFKLVFWAQNSSCSAYNTDDMSAITVNYTSVNCNDESRDAFYKMEEVSVADADVNRLVVLTRPFAQINFLASDAAGVVNVNQYKSKVTVTGVPTTLNTLDGSVADLTDVTFDYATILPNDETLAGYEQFRYVAMNYVLAATAKEMKNEVVLTVKDENNAEVNTVTVANCPVQRNYRTNIIGDLFTMEGNFNIEIDPIYNTPDIVPEMLPAPWDGSVEDPVVDGDNVTINNAAQLAGLARDVNSGNTYAGKTVTLTADLNLDNKPWIPIGNLVAYPGQSFNGTFDGGNHTIYNLKCDGDYVGTHEVSGLFGSTVGPIRNVTVKGAEITSNHYAAVIVAYFSTNKPLVIENCHAINCNVTSTPQQINGSWDDGDKVGGIIGYFASSTSYTIKNCTVDNCNISAFRDCGGIFGAGTWTTDISDNRVTNSTIIANQEGYAPYSKDFNVGAICGRKTGGDNLGDNNTYENVIVKGIANDGTVTEY